MDDRDDQPTIERRIRAAMALAGLDWDGLAKRINMRNYGSKTLQNMVSESFAGRVPRPGDLILIARACGVSEAFWHVDFAALDEPTLRVDVSRLRADLEELSADLEGLSRTVVQKAAELQEVRDLRLAPAPPADASQ